MNTYTPSKKLELALLNKRITELLEDIEKAKSHIDLVRTIGEANAIKYYPEPHHQPIQHPKYGRISPIYSKYICYKKYLPQWEKELEQRIQRERELCAPT